MTSFVKTRVAPPHVLADPELDVAWALEHSKVTKRMGARRRRWLQRKLLHDGIIEPGHIIHIK